MRQARVIQPTRKIQRGLTLMETIAAIVVLAIAVPPLLFSLVSAHDRQVDPVLISRAQWLAAEKLEDIIADRHSSTRCYEFVIEANYPMESSVDGFSQFSRSVEINETEADLFTPGSGFKIITVHMQWLDVRGEMQTMSVSTVVTDY